VVVRILTLCGLSVIALTVAACGGGSGSESFTRSEVLRILATSPTKPAGSSWTKDGGTHQSSPEELRRSVRSQGLPADAIDPLMDAGFQRGFEQRWGSSRAVANCEASLFPDAAAARNGFASLQHLVPSWFLPHPVQGLGDEAVSSKSDLGAIYMWRRANVVLSAGVFRGGGPSFDYDGAARTYADELDERAKT
jgi:hypothetical protein